MYTPSYLPRRVEGSVQTGGDYISTISTTSLGDTYYTDPSTLSTVDITLSSLQYIMQVANVTSIDALTTLTAAQISSLKGAIDDQITSDNAQITALQLSIAQVQSDIDGPNGLRAIFDLADFQYQSSLRAYNYTSSLLLDDQNSYASNISTLSSLYYQSTLYVDNINFYQTQYDNLVSSLQINASTFKNYEADYQASVNNLNVNSRVYTVALTELSTISTIVHNDLLQIPVNQPVYMRDLSTLQTISTRVMKYGISNAMFQSNIVSSYNNISTLLGPSSFTMFQAGTLLSTIIYYQGLDDLTESSIRSIQSDIDRINREISSLTASNAIVLNSMDGEINNVRTTGGQFYDLYRQALDAECDEYLYGIQELNAQIGYITASLGIARNANMVQIDQYIFTILSNPADTATANLKSNLIAANDKIYQIIQQINSLDTQFNNIISYIGVEKTDRQTFIEKRRDIFNNFEAPALGWDPQQIADKQADYLAAFADLNMTIESINGNVTQRNQILQGIQFTLNNPLPGQPGQSVRQLINNYFQLYLGSDGADQLYDNILYVKDTNGELLGGSFIIKEYNPPDTVLVATNIDHAFLPPIIF
jgi:cob(I)alamin adenosyltransferase